MKRSTWAFVILVTLAAVPVVVNALPRATPADWQAVAWLSLASIGASMFNFRARGQLVFTGFDGAAQLMAYLIGGLPVAVWVTGLGILTEKILLRRDPIKSLFNFSEFVLSLAATDLVYRSLGGSVGAAFSHPLEAAVASVAYMLVNHVIMTFLITTLEPLTLHEASSTLLDRATLFSLGTTFILGIIGAEMAMLGPAWAAMMALLVVALYMTFSSYFAALSSAQNRGAQLEAVLHATRAAILLTDPQGRVLLVNDSAARLLGRPADGLLNRPLAEVLPAELREKLAKAGDEAQVLTLDSGPARYVDWHRAPVTLADSPAPGFVQVFTDVTPIKEAEVRLKHMYQEMVRTLTTAIDARDSYTRGHSERVSQYAVAIARQMRLPEEQVDRIQYSALLHDVGKVGIDDRVLRKEGPLTPEERAMMMEHPAIGAEVLEPAEALRDLIPGVRWHHEWINGGGYPDRLKGEQIPLDARIISAADAFDAMTSSRPYRGAMTRAEALGRMAAAAGIQFDPQVVEAFTRVLTGGASAAEPGADSGLFALPDSGRIRPIHGREIAVLSELVQENFHGLDEREAAIRVSRVLSRHLGPYSYTTLLQVGSGPELALLAHVGPEVQACPAPEPREAVITLARAALREQRPVLVRDRTAALRAGTEGGLVALPLRAHGDTFGAFIIESGSPAAFHVDDLPVLAAMIGQLANALSLARLHQQLTHDAWHDALTGVGNRHLFHERLRTELKAMEAAGRPVALIMVDLHSLKHYNDKHGHPSGDQVLVRYAQRMQAQLRDGDTVARYGHDQFAIILPGASAEDATACVRRLQGLAGKRFMCDGKWLALPAAAFGIAQAPRDGLESLDLLAAADRNVRQQKRSGQAVSDLADRRIIALPR